jgi:hypothetical protein
MNVRFLAVVVAALIGPPAGAFAQGASIRVEVVSDGADGDIQ